MIVFFTVSGGVDSIADINRAIVAEEVWILFLFGQALPGSQPECFL